MYVCCENNTMALLLPVPMVFIREISFRDIVSAEALLFLGKVIGIN